MTRAGDSGLWSRRSAGSSPLGHAIYSSKLSSHHATDEPADRYSGLLPGPALGPSKPRSAHAAGRSMLTKLGG